MKMLILEFNELCPSLLARFMDAGLLPNFSRLYRQSEIYTTTTDDARLEPWVQWVTFHHGVPQRVHGVRDLDQGHTVTHPALWDILAAEGKSSIVFGAMNAVPAQGEGVFVIPDPWCSHVPVPAEFAPYQEFVRTNVLGHTNRPAIAERLQDFAAFAAFMASHGVSLSTIGGLLRQLLSEQAARRDVRWRRACCLDYLQWDVFQHLWRTKRPELAIFFSNSTAFLQHRYWRQMDPDAYEVKPTKEGVASYGSAIGYGYRKMDRLVGKALAIAGEGSSVALATALSQQPNLQYEKNGGLFTYRPRDFRRLLDLVGIAGDVSVEPVMNNQAWLSCRDEVRAAACERALLELSMNGEPIVSTRRAGSRVYFHCKFISQVRQRSQMAIRGKSVPFEDYFVFLGEVLNARHHPDGALWIGAAGGEKHHRVHERKLDLADASRLLLDRLSSTPSTARLADARLHDRVSLPV